MTDWPTGILLFDEGPDGPTNVRNVKVVPLDLARQMYEALVNQPPGDIEIDAAVERYEDMLGGESYGLGEA